MDDLLLARIEERHIHFLGRRGTAMDGLHEANHLQKSDLVHGAQVGLALGALLGVILGAVVVMTMQTEDRWQIVDRARSRNRRRAVRRLGLEHGRQRGAEFPAEAVRAGDRGRAKS